MYHSRREGKEKENKTLHMNVGECIVGKNERKIQTYPNPTNKQNNKTPHGHHHLWIESFLSLLHFSILRLPLSLMLCLVSPAPKKCAGKDSKGLVFCPELSSRSAITPEYDIMSLHLIFLGYNTSHLPMYLSLPLAPLKALVCVSSFDFRPSVRCPSCF